MKELYTSPELRFLCFASVESLANISEVEMDELIGGGTGVSADPNLDIDIPVIIN